MGGWWTCKPEWLGTKSRIEVVPEYHGRQHGSSNHIQSVLYRWPKPTSLPNSTSLLPSIIILSTSFKLPTLFFYLTTLSATHTVYQTYRQSHHAPQPVYYTLLLPNSLLLLYYCMMGPTIAQQNLDYLWPWLHNGRTISLSISG